MRMERASSAGASQGGRTGKPIDGRLRVAVVFALAMAVLATFSCCNVALAGGYGPFGDPQPVAIVGYSGSAEEPFITPDGRYLLFNSSEALPAFALQFATRVDAQQFEYQGEILGEHVNEPGSLSGTPSLDQEGNLYFISNRSYADTLSTVYTGRFSEGEVTDVHLVPGVSGELPGKVDFDVDVSPDGSTLYVSVGQFSEAGGPTSASIVSYERDGSSFVRDPHSAKLLAAVNAVGALDYAADPSPDGLELFFTAASPALGQPPAIYRATRSRLGKPFGDIERISAITGFAEAPSISSDGTTLYYHEQVGEQFEIETVTRAAGVPTITKVAPKTGPVAGETPVTITGTNLAGATSVRFGASDAIDITAGSATSITAVSPPGARGTVDVTVTTPSGTTAVSRKDHFKYVR